MDFTNLQGKFFKEIRQDTYALSVCPAFFVFFGLYLFAHLAIFDNGANLFFTFGTALFFPFWLLVFTSRIHYKSERSVAILLLLILFFCLVFEFYSIENTFATKNETYVLHDELATLKSVQKWGRGEAIVFEEQGQKGRKFVLYRWDKAKGADKLYILGATYSVSGFCHPFIARTKNEQKKQKRRYFDQWKFWQGRGVSSCLTSSKEPQIIAPPVGLFAIRQLLQEKINSLLLPKSKNYMEIFLLGERGKKVEELYKRSGVLHVMAISGLHVGLLIALLCFLFKDKFLRFFGGTFLLWSYVFLAGCPVSALRSAIMAQVLLFSHSLDLPRSGFNSVCIAGSLILLANPFCAIDVGFTLSFVCVLFLSALPEKLLRGVSSLCIVSALIWIVTAPILAHYFGIVSLTGILSNIFILPVFGVVFPLTVLLCFALLFFSFLQFLSPLLEAILSSFETYVGMFAKLPSVNVCQTDFLTFVASLIFFAVLYYKMTDNKAKSAVLAAIFSLAILLLH
ncbi:MAG: ComEC/Rec2 family competence protein [Synergistaceae bacterium]|nr:ComEC/Rec2 family competence protein [Synergistaceae bacterium]